MPWWCDSRNTVYAPTRIKPSPGVPQVMDSHWVLGPGGSVTWARVGWGSAREVRLAFAERYERIDGVELVIGDRLVLGEISAPRYPYVTRPTGRIQPPPPPDSFGGIPYPQLRRTIWDAVCEGIPGEDVSLADSITRNIMRKLKGL